MNTALKGDAACRVNSLRYIVTEGKEELIQPHCFSDELHGLRQGSMTYPGDRQDGTIPYL